MRIFPKNEYKNNTNLKNILNEKFSQKIARTESKIPHKSVNVINNINLKGYFDMKLLLLYKC